MKVGSYSSIKTVETTTTSASTAVVAVIKQNMVDTDFKESA